MSEQKPHLLDAEITFEAVYNQSLSLIRLFVQIGMLLRIGQCVKDQACEIGP